MTASRRSARITAIVCILIGAAACQPGHGGRLEPAAGQLQGPDGRYGGSGVSMVSSGPEIQIAGDRRTSLGSNTFDLQTKYRNLGDRALVLDATGFGIARGRERGGVARVFDMTSVDPADDRDADEMATPSSTFTRSDGAARSAQRPAGVD